MTAGAGPSEKEFQATLVQLLETFGYVVEHTYPLMTKGGFYRTGSTLKGKPDLIALRPPRLLAIEVKVGRRRPDPEQVAVLSLYAEVPCARAWLVRDTDHWDTIVGWVRRPGPAPCVYGFEPISVEEARRVVRDAGRRRTK